MRLLGCAVFVAVLTSGMAACGSSADRRSASFSTRIEQPRLIDTPTRREHRPAPGASGVVLARSGLGFVVASHLFFGGRPDGLGEIDRTRDFGRTWDPVWTQTRSSVWWVGFAGRDVVASMQTGMTPKLLRSRDEGRTWNTLRPTFPGPRTSPSWGELWPTLDFEFADGRTGLAHVDPDDYDSIGGSNPPHRRRRSDVELCAVTRRGVVESSRSPGLRTCVEQALPTALA